MVIKTKLIFDSMGFNTRRIIRADYDERSDESIQSLYDSRAIFERRTRVDLARSKEDVWTVDVIISTRFFHERNVSCVIQNKPVDIVIS